MDAAAGSHFHGCRAHLPQGSIPSACVVERLDGRFQRMAFDKAWHRTHDQAAADDVWIFGQCRGRRGRSRVMLTSGTARGWWRWSGCGLFDGPHVLGGDEPDPAAAVSIVVLVVAPAFELPGDPPVVVKDLDGSEGPDVVPAGLL